MMIYRTDIEGKSIVRWVRTSFRWQLPASYNNGVPAKAGMTNGEVETRSEIERCIQFLYLPRQAVLVQHVHEGVGVHLFHVEHAVARPGAGDHQRLPARANR